MENFLQQLNDVDGQYAKIKLGRCLNEHVDPGMNMCAVSSTLTVVREKEEGLMGCSAHHHHNYQNGTAREAQ